MSIDKETHDRDAQTVRGDILVEDNNVDCKFQYNREGSKIDIISAEHGSVELLGVFIWTKDIFAGVEGLIWEMIEEENGDLDDVRDNKGHMGVGL